MPKIRIIAAALMMSACGANAVAAPNSPEVRPSTTSTTTIPPTTSTSAPVASTTTPTSTTSTTVVERRGIPLAEARASGLWSPARSWSGCTSRYGDPSPEWLGEALWRSGWPASGWDKTCRVIGCESRFKPDAHGGLQGRMWFLLQADKKSWFRNGMWRFGDLAFTQDEMMDPVTQLTWFRALFVYINESRGTEEVWYGDQWTCNRA